MLRAFFGARISLEHSDRMVSQYVWMARLSAGVPEIQFGLVFQTIEFLFFIIFM